MPDNYLALLKKEYTYLTHKYKLKTDTMPAAQWQFFRLRPANFPTIRIAQFTAFLHQNSHVFDFFLHNDVAQFYKKLAVRQSIYWQKHYDFGKPTQGTIPGLGKTSIENILINTTVPLLVAYGKLKDEQMYIDKALEILQKLPAEHNKITRLWASLGLKVNHAFDAQALIELFNHFCSKKQCLTCNIGIALMKKI